MDLLQRKVVRVQLTVLWLNLKEKILSIKYAYCSPTTREYVYVETREELINILATHAAEIYHSHYCNGEPYTIVEVQEDGSEKWYTPTGEQRMTVAELEMQIKHMKSFENAGLLPVSML